MMPLKDKSLLRKYWAFIFWVLGFGFWVLGFGFWVLGFGFWVLGFGDRDNGKE
jgi:hypothetical protein